MRAVVAGVDNSSQRAIAVAIETRVAKTHQVLSLYSFHSAEAGCSWTVDFSLGVPQSHSIAAPWNVRFSNSFSLSR
jgi:hypothetical protein